MDIYCGKREGDKYIIGTAAGAGVAWGCSVLGLLLSGGKLSVGFAAAVGGFAAVMVPIVAGPVKARLKSYFRPSAGPEQGPTP